jgi:hypothetical protein
VGLKIAHEQGWTAPEGASAASGSGRRAPRTPGSTEVTPEHDEAKADKATTSTSEPPAPEETGGAANVSAQSASVPADDPSGTSPKKTKKKGS